eukprot:TRINITY_DN2773_c0_g2_i1.p1 TRINITY_DN2773_c0_g2~~TRINITY_DN2773_c0_g2_i1.p1  ORF type:complete len:223 (-),score=47.91 TRINITY_DN2773_c0_g2_i1:285-905(-)
MEGLLACKRRLEEDGAVRDRVKEAVKPLEGDVRRAMCVVATIQDGTRAVSPQNLRDALVGAEGPVTCAAKHFAVLKEMITADNFYKYHEQWRNHCSNLVLAIAIMVWMETDRLVTIAEVETLLGFRAAGDRTTGDENSRFHLDLEDFLYGLCGLPAELSRFAQNAVIRGDYLTSLRVSKFLHDLHAGAHQQGFQCLLSNVESRITE